MYPLRYFCSRRLCHAQNLTFNLLDEWNYRWRAHRQGHSDNRILRGIIYPQKRSVVFLVFSWFKPLLTELSLVVSIQTTELFSYQGSNFDPRDLFSYAEENCREVVIGFAPQASRNRSTSCLNFCDTFRVNVLA